MNATEIVPNLFMGGELWPAMPEGFGLVVGLRWEAEDYAAPLRNVAGLRTFLWFPMVDGPALPNGASLQYVYNSVVSQVLSGWKVLVHCAEGHNRSGLVVARALMLLGDMGAQQAIDLIREKRPGALTNQVFVDYLLGL